MRRAGKSTQPLAGCNGAQKSCNHVLTGSRCPTPITVTHLRTYGQAFDVTRLYIAAWMSKKKDRRGKHRQRMQQSATKTKSKLARHETKEWHVQTLRCKAAGGNNTESRTAAHNHVVRLHESSQPVKAKTVKEKTMEFHAGPRPSR